jgi:hypothetical protein
VQVTCSAIPPPKTPWELVSWLVNAQLFVRHNRIESQAKLVAPVPKKNGSVLKMLRLSALPLLERQAEPFDMRMVVEPVFVKPDHAAHWLIAGAVKLGGTRHHRSSRSPRCRSLPLRRRWE